MPWKINQWMQGSDVADLYHRLSLRFTLQDWSNWLKSTYQQPSCYPLLMTSAGWWPEVMSIGISSNMRDAPWTASCVQVDKGYSSTLQKRRQHYSRADKATNNTSGQSWQPSEESKMGSYNSTNSRHSGWTSGWTHTWPLSSATTDAWKRTGSRSQTPNCFHDHWRCYGASQHCPGSMCPSSHTICEWALAASWRCTQTSRPPTQTQSTSQVHSVRTTHTPHKVYWCEIQSFRPHVET